MEQLMLKKNQFNALVFQFGSAGASWPANVPEP
jgi:hypothetical protein